MNMNKLEMGFSSCFLKAKLQEEPSDTPLQEKLDTMAANIGYVGMACAAATFVATLCVYFTTHRVSCLVCFGRLCVSQLPVTVVCFDSNSNAQYLYLPYLGRG